MPAQLLFRRDMVFIVAHKVLERHPRSKEKLIKYNNAHENAKRVKHENM